MKKLLVSLLALCMVLTLSACSKSDDTPAGNDEPVVEYKDTILWAISNDQDVMDPQWNVSNSVVLPQVYSSLTFKSVNGVIPMLAEELPTVDESGLVWTVKLRKGVKFHQGQECTADDVVATFARQLDTNNPTRYTGTAVDYFKSCEKVDDYTVAITTNYPLGAFNSIVAGCNYAILCKDTLAQYDNANYNFGTDTETINGTGPYKVTAWTFQEEMTFEAFDEWFMGKPATKNIRMIYVPEQASRELALENHEVDIASGLNPDDVVRINNGEVDGVKIVSVLGNGLHEFQFNCKGQLADPELRQALVYAIDSKTIVDALYGPIGESVCTAPIAQGVEGVYDMGGQPYDQAKAKELLAKHGYNESNPLKIKIFTTAVYNKGIEMSEIMQQQFKAVGVECELIPGDRAQFLAQFDYNLADGYAPEWDLLIMGMGANADLGLSIKRVCMTEYDAQGRPANTNVNNYGFYSNARLDEIINITKASADAELRTQLFKEAAEILFFDDPFGIWMNYRNNIYGVAEGLEGLTVTADNTPSFETITVKK